MSNPDLAIGALAKPEPRKRVKARRKRQEATVATGVRAQCVERDGYCLLRARVFGGFGRCLGPSEWAHIGTHRRAHTRGQAAARRHTTAGSGMLCQRHHAAYDAHEFDLVPSDAALGMNGNFQVVTRR